MTALTDKLLGGRDDREEWAQVDKLLRGRDDETEWWQIDKLLGGRNDKEEWAQDCEKMDTGTPSAAYLHGRINILTHQLRSRMMNIIRLTKPPEHATVTNIATEQLRMDVESTALIRAAEEVMVLTRELKDLWLFGGLNTLHTHEKSAADNAMEADAKVVYEFMSKMVNGRSDSRTEKVPSPAVVDVMEVETGST